MVREMIDVSSTVCKERFPFYRHLLWTDICVVCVLYIVHLSGNVQYVYQSNEWKGVGVWEEELTNYYV